MKHLLINSNKNNMSLALVWCQAREKTEPLIEALPGGGAPMSLV